MAVSEDQIARGVVRYCSWRPENKPTEVVQPATPRIYTFSQIPWESFAQATGGDLSHHFSGSVIELRKKHAFIYLDSPDSFLGHNEAGEKKVLKIDGAVAVIGEDYAALLQPPVAERNGKLESVKISKVVVIPKEGEIKEFKLEVSSKQNDLVQDILSVVAARAKEIEAIYR